jgi:O-antigen ligase
MRQHWANRLLLLTLFLLPWQTRWIFFAPAIGGETSEYGQISLYATELLLFVVVLLRGRPLYRSGMQFVMQAGYFFLAAVFFSLGFTPYFQIGLGHVLHLIFAFALFSAFCDVRTPLKQSAVAFISGLMIPTLFGWWQVITGTSSASTWFGLASKDAETLGIAIVETANGRMLRAYGTFPHPNVFGGFIAVALVVLAWLVRSVHSRRALFLSVIPVVLLSATLIVTFSRSAWLGITIGFLTLLALMLKRHRVAPSRAFPIMILGFITLLSTFFIFYNQIFSRVQIDGRVEQISINERASQFSRFNDVFVENPALGSGPGAYTFALFRIDPNRRAFSYQPIHNTWLLILGELGVVGLAVLLYLIFRVDQVSSRSAKTAGGMLGLALGIALIVISLFDHYLWSLWPGLALSAIALSFIVNWASSSDVDR